MNWLAHVFLSKPDVEFRLGNLLADLVKGPDRVGMPTAFLEGVRQHQAIDGFTDYHPVVHRSRARIVSEYRHVTGILVDIFYDHFLAINWERYVDLPFEDYTAKFYAEVRAHPVRFPYKVQEIVDHMVTADRLTPYRTVEGIERALHRVSQRLSERTGKDFRLEGAISELHANFEGLASDFTEFFPQLQAHVDQRH